MADYLFHETVIGDEYIARAYADDITGIPTRVEIKGDTKKYRFYLGDVDRKESFSVDMEGTKDITSLPIDPILASKVNTKGASLITWMCGVEGS
jgi:hypothetical protein